MNRYPGNNQGIKTLYGKSDATDYYNIRRVQQVCYHYHILSLLLFNHDIIIRFH